MPWTTWVALLIVAFVLGIAVTRTILRKTVDCMHHDPRKTLLRESDSSTTSFIRERASAFEAHTVLECCRCGHRWIDQGDLW